MLESLASEGYISSKAQKKRKKSKKSSKKKVKINNLSYISDMRDSIGRPLITRSVLNVDVVSRIAWATLI